MSSPGPAPATPRDDETVEAPSAELSAAMRVSLASSEPSEVTQPSGLLPSGLSPVSAMHDAPGPESAFDLDDKTFIRSVAPTQGGGPTASNAVPSFTSPASKVSPGTRRRFGDYELVRELARGGMGVVYEAVQKSLARTVAVELILAGEFASQEQVQRFFAEARSVAHLDHPNIVPVFEVGEQAGLHFFSMKLVDGGSLSGQLAGFVDKPREAAALLEKVARAVHHAHQRGVLHRDIKPGNILLDRAGEPMVTDFGLAKIVSDESNVTRSDAVIGTPAYMAPEQCRGARFATTATDTWALGAILYNLLTGVAPFRGETAHQTLRLVQDEEPIPPRQRIARVPRDLEAICLKCLQKEPAKRYASAEALAEDLRRFRAGEPVSARPVARSERIWRWCRRNPGLATTGAVAIVAVAAAIVILAVAVAKVSHLAQQREADNLKLEASNRTLEREVITGRISEAIREPDPSVKLLRMIHQLKDAERVGATDMAPALRLDIAAWASAIHPLRTVVRHDNGEGGVTAVALSQDGAVALTGGISAVRAFDASSGKLLGPEMRQSAEVKAMLAVPNEHRVLVGLKDGSCRWWNYKSGQPHDLPAPKHRAELVAFILVPGSHSRVLSVAKDGVAQLCDLATGQKVGPDLSHANGGVMKAAAVSHDGGLAATGADDGDGKPGGTIRLWNLNGGNSVGKPIHFDGQLYALEFSGDGKRLLLTTGSSTSVLDLSSRTVTDLPAKMPETITAAALSPGGRHVLIAENGNSVRAITLSGPSAATGTLQHANLADSVGFSADGKWMITGSKSGMARIWQVRDLETERATHATSVTAAALSGDGSLFAIGTEEGLVRVCDAVTMSGLGEYSHGDQVLSLTFTPDGRYLLSGSADNTARLWDVRGKRAVGEPIRHVERVTTVACSPDGTLLLTGSADGEVQIHRATDLSTVRPGFRHASLCFATFSPDSRIVATAGSDDGVVRLWRSNAKPDAPILEIQADAAGVWSVAFTLDGTKLATAGKDHTSRIWDVSTGKQIGAALRHQDEVLQVAFSADGKRLAVSSRSSAGVWDLASGGFITVEGSGSPATMAFSGEGRFLAVGGQDGTVILWDAEYNRALGPAIRYSTPINALAFNSSANRLLVATLGRLEPAVIQLRPIEPARGTPPELARWIRHSTGLSLEGDALRVLDAERWASNP